MKKILIYVGTLVSYYSSAQTTEPKPTSVSNPLENINRIFPAGPTVNNLMKFEEVPVSNYTGIPEIKIPLSEISTQSPQVVMNVSLNYHPLNAKPDEKAGEAGLGWNIFAGGSITRTIRGTPDDMAVLMVAGGQPSIGIYYDEYTSSFTDKNYTRKYLDALTTGIGLNPGNTEFKKLFYEGLFQARFDMEYDLYQYNFMGNTGRFIIKKDANNQLFVDKLDKNNLKISINSTNQTNIFQATSFLITDEYGNKYIFDVIEKSKRSTLSDKVGFRGYVNTNTSDMAEVPSAFHLSKVTNTDDSELVQLHYYPTREVYYTDYSTINRAADFPVDPSVNRFDPEIPAVKETYVTNTTTQVRNLQDIEVSGKGKILFSYTQGREDSNFTNPQQLVKLDKISLADLSGKVLETYQFDYGYFTYRILGNDLDDKRLSLNKITRYNADSVKQYDYIFDYYHNNSGLSLGKDYWDFFNCVKPTDNYLIAKEPSEACVKVNMLKSIKLPSGGLRHFDLGANTYSYIAGNPVDPYLNSDNWQNYDSEISYVKSQNNTKKYFFTISSAQSVEINALVDQIKDYSWNVTFFRKEGNNYVQAGSIGPSVDADPDYPTQQIRNFEPGEYYASLNVDFSANFNWSANFIASYKEKKTTDVKQYVLGGGVRVNNISYYNSSADPAPVKKTSFSYNDGSGLKSSGSLVFPIPVHSYKYNYYNTFVYRCTSVGDCKEDYSNNFTVFSSANFIPVQKTRGADVGYQYVSVFETGKGKSTYAYTSPIDMPNPESVSSDLPPFVPIGNYDHKRGLMIGRQEKDNSDVLLSKKTNQYNIYDSEKLTGISLRHINAPYTEYLYAGHFKTYEAYINGCVNNNYPSSYCNINGGEPAGMIAITPVKEIIGQANPIHSESTEFLNGKTVAVQEDMVFNARDYLTKKTNAYSDGTSDETNYSYAHEKGNQLMIERNMIGIPLETVSTQTVGNTTKTLSRSETIYPTSMPTSQSANLVLPLSVKSYDVLNNTASYTEATYDKYDSKGNLQQYTTKDGISTVIIWGYDHTQPIAKIEGAQLSNISQSLIDTIVNASNTDAQNGTETSEQNLISALDTFRSDASISGYQISTYTYDPLIGVRSITPPSGIREYYRYDSANRLEKVIDSNNKVLKEFKYNYKN
ncbi:hypothetical protein [uncultured Chryseobacterium sp.]|uniref:hypothetical protein n=1 Tax=uncultured Chryseobacterium sp. TaxID=259322 RepID=UPI0025DB2CDE|nr:hypothetical protein [uncultured Chryseobacterium sp.]